MARNHHIRILLLSVLAAIAILLGGCLPGSTSPPDAPASQAISARGLNVHFIDVGQGDCILAESQGHFLLIDGGERDQADRVVSYLKQAGVTRLDYVIGTHPHSDHIGSLARVIDTFDVGTVIMPPVEHTSKTFEDLLDAISNKGLTITKPVPGTGYSLGEAAFTIVAPVKDYGTDLNNWSVGIRLAYGSNSFLMCGDAEREAEEDMVNSGALLASDVLKAGHHGSSTSTTDAFLKKVSPAWVVIQCGKDNPYGHPHKETMEKLKKAGCKVFRTDEDGTIIAHSDGKNIDWKTSSGPIMDGREKRGRPGSTNPAGSQGIQESQGTQESQDTQESQNPAGSQNTAEGQNTAETPSSQPGDQSEQTYIINTNTKKFHLPNCSSTSQIRDENRRVVTTTRDELIKEGYTPCKQCKP